MKHGTRKKPKKLTSAQRCARAARGGRRLPPGNFGWYICMDRHIHATSQDWQIKFYSGLEP